MHRLQLIYRWLARLGSLCGLLAITTGGAMANDTATRHSLTFGVVPQQSAIKLARQWGPLLNAVGEQAGVTLRFATAPDIPSFEKRVAAGDYDLVYMNPYHYTVFHRTHGFNALVKARDKRIRGILVVAHDSPLCQLSDVSNMEIAFPAPAAFAATLLAQGNLSQRKIPYRSAYLGSHDAVYRAVASGRVIAGGGIERTFNALESSVREKLRILWQSEGFTPHAIASHPRVGESLQQKIQHAFSALGQTEPEKALVSALKISGFEPAVNSDWDDVRALPLNRPLAFETNTPAADH